MNKNKKRAVDKRAIIQAVRAKGFSARKSAKAVNAVIDAWKFALWCGEEVEVPGGILQAKTTQGTEWATLQYFQNIATKQPMVRTVRTPGRRKVIKLKPDPKLVLPLDLPTPPPPQPPPPETGEAVEERQLVAELLGRAMPPDAQMMAIIRKAVGVNPRTGEALRFQPGALLRRLRHFQVRGWNGTFPDAYSLARQISEFHWL